jgi:geranylgeranyl reductase family protein
VPVSSQWDVANIGAGPAGLAAASAAARAGARTLVLERAEHPRYKTCGGGLIGISLAAVGDMPVPVKDEIHAATFTLGSRREFTRTHQAPILAMVRREEFDDALRRRAEADGAVLQQRSQVRAISQDGGQASARLADGTTVTAAVLVGADGSAGVCGRHVGVRADQVDLGLEVEVAAPESVHASWHRRVLLDWGPMPGSYAWIFPKDDRLTVGVIAARGHGEQTRSYLRAILDQHRLASFPVLQDSGHLTRCRSADSPLRRGRVLVAGDAAALLEPWTREGISFALRSGALAGTAAAAAAGEPATRTEEALRSYELGVQRDLVPEMAAGRQLFAAFARHPGFFHRALASAPGWHMFVRFCQGEMSFATLMDHTSARLTASLLASSRLPGRRGKTAGAGTQAVRNKDL